jgi:predicted DNA-binding transcriptional regulator AlpA
MSTTNNEETRFLDLHAVQRLVPVSRQTVETWSRTGKFPPPRRAGPRRFWVEAEITAWMKNCPVKTT